MPRFFLPAICLGLSVWAATTPAEEPQPSKPSVVMGKKLEYSQDMLRALMNDDFDRLERDVKLMNVFTRLEEMYRAKLPGYETQLTKFRDSISSLSKSIADKNPETASQAYTEMVQSCIRCHQIMRKH